MLIQQCKNCPKAYQASDDNVHWVVCNKYDVSVQYVTYCGYKKEKSQGNWGQLYEKESDETSKSIN